MGPASPTVEPATARDGASSGERTRPTGTGGTPGRLVVASSEEAVDAKATLPQPGDDPRTLRVVPVPAHGERGSWTFGSRGWKLVGKKVGQPCAPHRRPSEGVEPAGHATPSCSSRCNSLHSGPSAPTQLLSLKRRHTRRARESPLLSPAGAVAAGTPGGAARPEVGARLLEAAPAPEEAALCLPVRLPVCLPVRLPVCLPVRLPGFEAAAPRSSGAPAPALRPHTCQPAAAPATELVGLKRGHLYQQTACPAPSPPPPPNLPPLTAGPAVGPPRLNVT